MEFQQYSALKTYLQYRQYPPHYDTLQQRQLENQSKFFQVKNGKLYNKNKRQSGKDLKVILEEELARLPLHPSESEEILNGTILQRLYEIDHDLPEAHNNALYQISKEQQKQKERHDRQIKVTVNFEIGPLEEEIESKVLSMPTT
ncbi:hypothetical protein C2G38_2252809 [Gigaspora rosea]|uniref:Uncharacterized protein n=1 Tax=Gigaspora rosea TaxID=44941 RepID=A0A397UD96_9GLOM|nr:hypothetical protein C2G38_2252809 [Gigaspora rosea]